MAVFPSVSLCNVVETEAATPSNVRLLVLEFLQLTFDSFETSQHHKHRLLISPLLQVVLLPDSVSAAAAAAA